MMPVGPDSRRYVMFEVSSAMRGNSAYFEALSRHIDDPHTRHEFYCFLMERDLAGVNLAAGLPHTEYRQAAVEMNMEREHLFLRDHLVEAHRALRADEGPTPEQRHCATELFNMFTRWLKKGRFVYDTNKIRFGRRMTTLAEGEGRLPGMRKAKGAQGMDYFMDPDTMLRAMVERGWMRQEELYRADDVEVSSPVDLDPLEARVCVPV